MAFDQKKRGSCIVSLKFMERVKQVNESELLHILHIVAGELHERRSRQ